MSPPPVNPKDSMKSTWRTNRAIWWLPHYVIDFLGVYPNDLDKEVPVFNKSTKVPVSDEWSVHLWILAHAIWPILLQYTYTAYTGNTMGPLAIFLLYLLAMRINAIHEVNILRKLGHQYGFFDGDKAPRDQIPDSGVAKALLSVQMTTAIRPLMTVALAANSVIEDHDLHHRVGWKKSHNYGKQTRLWDRLFGTCTDRIECHYSNIDWSHRYGTEQNVSPGDWSGFDMEAFISRRKRLRFSSSSTVPEASAVSTGSVSVDTVEEESTDVKLAILLSLHPHRSLNDLLELLLDCNGSVEGVLEMLSSEPPDTQSPGKKRQATTIGYQSALPFAGPKVGPASNSLTKKGKTLHLYSPEDIAAHTPCSIIHNFLPAALANDLLEELLPEVASYTSATFRLFDNIVRSPHTACFYVADRAERIRQLSDYLYNGSTVDDIRELLPVMRKVSELVRKAVNEEIATRISTHYLDGKKLRFQSPKEWRPTAAFVNCYDGPQQCVGYHSDQLSYLGPRAVIGSLSLGVAREFRVRRIVPPPDDSPVFPESPQAQSELCSPQTQADIQGQISIHLPHNSLLVMHAEMQEEWKHSIAPSLSIDPHPIAGNKRLNITYRWYREEFSPKYTPRCRCGVPTVLKCVQKRKETRGSDSKGCGYFEWAKFTDDGDPIWKTKNPG
ncbi:hypothetical protein DV736_g5990, partial [Chaetothyriales sp. CBS 134916]